MACDSIVPEGAKAIPLTQGRFTIVDEADYEWLSQWKWYFSACGKNNGGYAVRKEYLGRYNGRDLCKTILMHRLIIGAPDDVETDHWDRNKLNNRRYNLRLATHAQNSSNKSKTLSKTSSKYKGVTWYKPTQKWCAKIYHGKTINLGYFLSEDEAALAYDEVAKEKQKMFSVPNHAPKPDNHKAHSKRIKSSKYKGVTCFWHTRKWRAYIHMGKKIKHLGYFDYEIDAALAHNAAALQYHGEFARLNEINTE